MDPMQGWSAPTEKLYALGSYEPLRLDDLAWEEEPPVDLTDPDDVERWLAE